MRRPRRRTKSRTAAQSTHALALSMVRSKSLANRRQRFSQAKVRSTTQRRGRTAKPLLPGGLETMMRFRSRLRSRQGRRKFRARVAPIREQRLTMSGSTRPPLPTGPVRRPDPECSPHESEPSAGSLPYPPQGGACGPSPSCRRRIRAVLRSRWNWRSGYQSHPPSALPRVPHQGAPSAEATARMTSIRPPSTSRRNSSEPS